MKAQQLSALLAVALLSVFMAGCGGASSSNRTASTRTGTTTAYDPNAIPYHIKADSDKDNDFGGFTDEPNNDSTINYGHAATATEQRAITALIKRYYTVALAEDGAAACSLLYSTLAEGVAEDYGHSPPGPPYMAGNTCPTVMQMLFRHFHRQLTAELPLLHVSRVRLKAHRGWVLLSFGSLPEREISVTREGSVWKVDLLLDIALP